MNTKGTKVVLKFFLSKGPNNVTKLISRTLGKLSLIEEKYAGQVGDQEIWICEIEKEIGPNKNHGAFLVRPISKVAPERIKKLIPGFYNALPNGKTVYLFPKDRPNEPWLVSIDTRKIFNTKYTSIIVPIETEEGSPEEGKAVEGIEADLQKLES